MLKTAKVRPGRVLAIYASVSFFVLHVNLIELRNEPRIRGLADKVGIALP